MRGHLRIMFTSFTNSLLICPCFTLRFLFSMAKRKKPLKICCLHPSAVFIVLPVQYVFKQTFQSKGSKKNNQRQSQILVTIVTVKPLFSLGSFFRAFVKISIRAFTTWSIFSSFSCQPKCFVICGCQQVVLFIMYTIL